jgi:hypothetical protein
LEIYEERYTENLRRIVLPKAPEPIGIAGATDEIKTQHAPEIDCDADVSLLIPPPPSISFWEKYKKNTKDKDFNNGADSSNESDVDEKNKMVSDMIKSSKLAKYHTDKTPTTFRMNSVIGNKSLTRTETNNTNINDDGDDSSTDMQQSLPTPSSSSRLLYQPYMYSPLTSSRRRRRRSSGSIDETPLVPDPIPTSSLGVPRPTIGFPYHQSSSSSLHSSGWRNMFDPMSSTPTSVNARDDHAASSTFDASANISSLSFGLESLES